MAYLGVTVSATTTPQSLAALLTAAQPVVLQSGGINYNQPPANRALQLLIQPAGAIFVGSKGLTSTNYGSSLIAAQVLNIGTNAGPVVDLADIYLQAGAGTVLVGVTIID